jgi:hypothetical protein
VRIDLDPTTSVKKRFEELDFVGLVKRWWVSVKSKWTRNEDAVQRFADLRNSLDVLGAVEGLNSKGWFTTVMTNSSRFSAFSI